MTHSGMATTRLLLVRHGQSTWNADGRWQGQADPPLERARRAAGGGSGDPARRRRRGLGVGPRSGAAHRGDRRRGPRRRRAGRPAAPRAPRRRLAGPDTRRDRATMARVPRVGEASRRLRARRRDPRRASSTRSTRSRPHTRVTGRRRHPRRGGPHARAPSRERRRRIDPQPAGRRLRRDGAEEWALGDQVLLLGADTVTVPRQL